MDDNIIASYKHIDCENKDQKILLICKDCKALICAKCILENHQHCKLQLVTTTVEVNDSLPNRKPVESLSDLHQSMAMVVKNIKQTLIPDSSNPFKDRDNQFRQVESFVIELFDSFTKNDSDRKRHFFLQCLNGSGIGKTRFIKECAGFLKKNKWKNIKLEETMKDLVYIDIDFNGGGDSLSQAETKQCGFQEALSKRLFVKGVLGVSLNKSNLKLHPKERQLFSLNNVLEYIAKLYRNDCKKTPLSILIHLDEFPIAHQISCKHDEYYIKQMIELLGNYRCDGSNNSTASKNNIFIIPVLSGTTTILQKEINISQWLYKSINLTPLSYSSCKEIIREKFKIPYLKGKKESILENRLFTIFIMDLGVIPTYFDWLIRLDCLNKIEDPDIDVSSFIGELALELDKKVLSLTINDDQFLEAILYHSICRVPVYWDTIICGKTIESWSFSGNLFLQFDEAINGNVIFISIFDLFKIASRLQITSLKQLTKFPLTHHSQGTTFEENTAILIMHKINYFLKSGNPTTSMLSKFFPLDDCINHELLLKEVKICKVLLYKHKTKWLINGSNDTLDISSTDTSSVNLFGSGNTSFETIRICFELSNPEFGKKYLIVAINTKFSNSDTYIGEDTIEKIHSNSNILNKTYNNAYIFPIVLTNFKVKETHIEKFKDKVIIYHSKNIQLFYGMLLHRVLLE